MSDNTPMQFSEADNLMVSTARTIATAAHVQQSRSDGKPYITHPQAVAAMFDNALLQAIAWLHDVIEDTHYTEADLRQQLPAEVVDRVVLLSRRAGETYAEFIERIGTSRDAAAIQVKLADLRHNLSDLLPGSKRDKYELAQLYLQIQLYSANEDTTHQDAHDNWHPDHIDPCE